MLAMDGEKHLIEVPFVAEPRTPTPELMSIVLSELTAPFRDGFIRHAHTPDEQEFLHITIIEVKLEIEPHTVANDLGRAPMIFVEAGRGASVHAARMPHCEALVQAGQQVDNASPAVPFLERAAAHEEKVEQQSCRMATAWDEKQGDA